MKKTIVLLLAILLSVPFLMAQPGSHPADYSYIEVTGKASREVVPDRIYLSISLHEKDFRNKSLAEVERDMVTALKKAGVDVKSDLKVRDMASAFKKHFILKDDVRLAKDYQVVVKDGKTAATVFLALQEKGISGVEIEKTECSNIEQLRNEVKVDAVKDAREKARMMVEAIDQTLGRAVIINELVYSHYPRNKMMVRANAAAVMDEAENEALEVEFEPEKLSYSVQVRFLIE